MINTHRFFSLLLLTVLSHWTLNAADAAPDRTAQLIDRVIAEAETYLGSPHRLGGTNQRGIDCSGLMVQSFRAAGIELPRSSSDQAGMGRKITVGQLQRGDLVFFTIKGKINHVGLVTSTQVGATRFIHTSTSRGVMYSSLADPYWKDHVSFGRRIWDEPIIARQPNQPTFRAAPGLFPQASQRVLRKKEVKALSPRQAEVMQAEIWARNGYRFRETEWRRYFEAQDWYRELETTPRKARVKRQFSDIEKKNLRTLRKVADLEEPQ